VSSWWRTNRWWLPALPVAVAAMATGSGYLLHDYWWIKEPRWTIASGDQGDVVRVSGHYTDAIGETTQSFTVQLDGIESDDTVVLDANDVDPDRPLPAGTRSVRVHLSWTAEPDQLLRGCTVAVIDSEGRRYEGVADGDVTQCVPDGHGGPVAAVVKGDDRAVPEGEERPSVWTTEPQFLVPEDVRITQVLVWWQLPDHVQLDVS
jgi:hypothetical protein